MADFSRQGLKKNELEDFILKTADWAKNNRQLFSGGLSDRRRRGSSDGILLCEIPYGKA